MEIAAKTAVVTGSARGIGRIVATRLAAEHAAVVVADVDEREGRRTAELLTRDGMDASFFYADVTNVRDVKGLVEHAVERHGGLDILVNNAGGYTQPVFPEAPVRHWSSVLDLNLLGPMLAIHHALGAMTGGGAIVNVASTAGLGLGPHPGPEYAAAKAGLMRLTGCLASLADRGIRVNCVCPYTVGTESVLRTIAELQARGEALPEPLGAPLLEPSEIADAVVDLIRDERLAGRVVLLRGGEPRRLLPVSGPIA